MARRVFYNVYIVCEKCGHRNRPNPSPLQSAILLIEGWQAECRGGCGKTLKPDISNSTRPIFEKARKIIAARTNQKES